MESFAPLPQESLSTREEAASLLLCSSPSTSSSFSSSQQVIEKLLVPEGSLSDKPQNVQQFYKSQNTFLSSLLELASSSPSCPSSSSSPISEEKAVDEESQILSEPSDSAALDKKLKDAAFQRQSSFAINASLFATFFMLTLKLFAALSSGSIAILSSAADSFLDILSQGTLVFTNKLINRKDPYNFPGGKSRIEPFSIVVFAVIMAMAAFFLFYQSMLVLVKGLSEGSPEIVDMNAYSVASLIIIVTTQFCFFLWCRKLAKHNGPGSAACDALAQDHINDVCINLMGGIPAIIAGYGSASVWFIDPVGGILLSIYIAARWIAAYVEQVGFLVGRSAPRDLIGQLVFLAATHDSRVLKVDTVLAYYVGSLYQVEVHIVLPADMPLRESHDIAESLEKKIEALDSVCMAFVHSDYEWAHAPEHKIRQS